MMTAISLVLALTLAVSGFTVAINLALAAAIFFCKQTRSAREYVMVVGTLVMDTIFNLAYLISSVIRVVTNERPSRLSCTVQAFPCVFFVIGTPLVGFSVVLVAADRLYAVICPVKYYKSDAKRAWVGVAVSVGITLAMLALIVFTSLGNYSKCVLGFESLSTLMPIFRYMRIASISVAIACYAVIYAYMRSNHEKVSIQLGQQQAMDRMMSILKTTVITVLTTVVFIFIPDICLSLGMIGKLVDWLNFMIMFKGAANIFIYTLRHPDIRKSISTLFICKRSVPVNTIVAVLSDFKRQVLALETRSRVTTF